MDICVVQKVEVAYLPDNLHRTLGCGSIIKVDKGLAMDFSFEHRKILPYLFDIDSHDIHPILSLIRCSIFSSITLCWIWLRIGVKNASIKRRLASPSAIPRLLM